jgi:hypothetical protein
LTLFGLRRLGASIVVGHGLVLFWIYSAAISYGFVLSRPGSGGGACRERAEAIECRDEADQLCVKY